jgi:hypothetical protein
MKNVYSDDPTILEPNEVRAARKTSFMPRILAISTFTAAILLLAIFAVFAA